MNSIGQYAISGKRGGITLLVLAVALSSALILLVLNIPSSPSLDTRSASDSQNWVEPVSLKECDWSVIQSSTGTPSAAVGSVAKRFRLAGTFIVYGGVQDKRSAILDDLKENRQQIIKENQELESFLVLRIFADRVVMRGPQGEEQLRLSFSNNDNNPATATVAKKPDSAFSEKTGRFGKQVGKRSYVYNRESLVQYYNELMDEPQRLVAVFDSLKPIWTKDRKIEGYELDIQGESSFFKEIGWKQGDIVRSVNSMKMTNRHRAEYFIREFVADRANAFLIDMERGDGDMKMVYRVR